MKKDKQQWDIDSLEAFFKSIELPQTATIYNLKILDVPKFVESHLLFIKANKQKQAFRSYFDRLSELQNNLKQTK